MHYRKSFNVGFCWEINLELYSSCSDDDDCSCGEDCYSGKCYRECKADTECAQVGRKLAI